MAKLARTVAGQVKRVIAYADRDRHRKIRSCSPSNVLVVREMGEESPGHYRLPDFDGLEVEIPISKEDDYSYFPVENKSAIRPYYRENGYVVVRNALSAELCDAVQASFEAEVKPFPGFIYRQITANPERHIFTDQGFLLNTILNIQSVDRRRFGGFRQSGLTLLTHQTMQELVTTILGESGKLVQSMYFEGNPETHPIKIPTTSTLRKLVR